MKPRNYILVALIRRVLGILTMPAIAHFTDPDRYVKPIGGEEYTIPSYMTTLADAAWIFLLFYVGYLIYYLHNQNEKELIEPQYDPSRPTTHRPP